MPNPASGAWDYMGMERRNIIFSTSYGCPGSKMRSFIKKNYHQWNVKNWIELATREFVSMNAGKILKIQYTPKHDLGDLLTIEGQLMGLDEDEKNGKQAINMAKEDGEVLAKIVINIPYDYSKSYGIFGGGGNEFFFGGDFEAEKVEESDWYDVKRFAVTHLFFMDKLGRKHELLKGI